MNVKHNLSPVGVAVGDHPVSAGGHSQLSGYDRSHCQDVPDDGFLLRGEVVEGRDVYPGDDDGVDRRGRVDVLEGHADVVLEDQLGGDLPGGNLAEDAITHSSNLPARWVPQGASRGQTALAVCMAGLICLLFSCAGVSSSGSKDLQTTVKRFHHDLRWKYYDAAAARVSPEHSQAFLDTVEDEKNELNISAWEIRKVEFLKPGSEARIRVQFKYHRMPSTVIKSLTVDQVWRKVEDGWFLFEQDKGPFVLPPPKEAREHPGVSEDAPAP